VAVRQVGDHNAQDFRTVAIPRRDVKQRYMVTSCIAIRVLILAQDESPRVPECQLGTRGSPSGAQLRRRRP
jgi:hypothetical protein